MKSRLTSLLTSLQRFVVIQIKRTEPAFRSSKAVLAYYTVCAIGTLLIAAGSFVAGYVVYSTGLLLGYGSFFPFAVDYARANLPHR